MDMDKIAPAVLEITQIGFIVLLLELNKMCYTASYLRSPGRCADLWVMGLIPKAIEKNSEQNRAKQNFQMKVRNCGEWMEKLKCA
jgi:hypothetical protein